MKTFLSYTLMVTIFASIGTTIVTLFGIVWITDYELHTLVTKVCITSIITFIISAITWSNSDL